ncbi:MAG: DMT family transporter [Anaerolineae bacterium]|nr:DMT family transporter [Anaerolineae bacterium]
MSSHFSFSPRTTALLKALFVTFLWSTSWVLIKIGLDDIPALTFAGLRYTFAATCLLIFARQRGSLSAMSQISRRDWAWLAILGLIFIAVAQGSQFLALVYLPAVTLTLFLNFTAIFVIFLGIWLLHEYPTSLQLFGIGLFMGGVLLFFYPIELPHDEWLGLGIATVCVLANSAAGVLGRHINRQGHLPALTVTLTSMSIGAVVLLVTGVVTQGLPSFDLQGWAIIAWLAVVNTAFAFTVWNQTLRILTALESSIINNTMLAQISLLAWIFLGEDISRRELIALVIASIGSLLSQVRQSPRRF